jgi:DNA-binding PadR family transcriptional regulator
MPSVAEFELRVLLTVLRCGESGYAAAVHEDLEARSKQKTSVGAVYVTLDRLERKGLLESTLGEPRAERGGRARRHYRLSKRGQDAVRLECRTMQALWRGLGVVEERR